jgi:hypothetical protein
MSSDKEPTPISDLDVDLRVAIKRWHRVRWMLVGVMAFVVIVLTVAVVVLVFRTTADEQRIESSCEAWRLVGSLPVVVKSTPKVPMTSHEGVVLILSAREAFTGQACPGRLPKPSPGFMYLEKLYHLGG